MDNTLAVQQFERYLQRRFPGRSTAVHYISDLRQFEKVCQKPWGEVTRADIEAFVDYGREAEWAARTVRRRLATLKTFFEFWGEETGLAGWVNPVEAGRQAPKVGRRLPRDLSDEAVVRLWEVIEEPRDQAWFALMLRGGLRVGEVVGLERGDILRVAEGVEPARLRVKGKGQKERVAYLSADGYAVLARWLVELPEAAETPVCLNRWGERMSVSGVQERMRHYAEAAGLHATCHQLRHTYARQLVEQGLPVTTLAKLMGHEDLSTTGIYILGADPEVRRAYQQAMAKWDEGPLWVASRVTTASNGQAEAGGDKSAAGMAKSAAEPVEPRAEAAPAQEGVSTEVAAVKPGPASSPLPSLPERAVPACSDLAETWAPELPGWVREASLRYVQQQAQNWKASQQRRHSLRRLQALKQFWTWQLGQRKLGSWAELTRADVQAYLDASQAKRQAPSTLKNVVYPVWGVLRQEQARGASIPESVFRVELPKEGEVLPRHLSDSEAARLEAYMQTYQDQDTPEARRDAAWYLVLAHTGLRLNELIDLRYGDLDLSGGRLRVEQGKGLRDRVVYLDPPTQRALERYLAPLPRPADAAPLFYRTAQHPLGYRWVQERLHKLGEAAGVKGVTPHRLRHTFATQLLNQGVPITTVQALLGHEDLNSTQRYARVSAPTVEHDYRQAMSSVEHRAGALHLAPVTLEELGLASPVTLREGAKLPLDNSM